LEFCALGSLFEGSAYSEEAQNSTPFPLAPLLATLLATDQNA
jgi:hypothetical protein